MPEWLFSLRSYERHQSRFLTPMRARLTQELITWLEQSVSAMEPGARLPSDSEIASRWGLSLRTVKTVLRDLGRRGLVTRVQGRGTFVPHRVQSPPEPGWVKQDSCDSLVDTITQAIASGELKLGEPLPAVKYLAVTYRISRRTVMAAYRELASRGLVHRVGRLYWVGSLRDSLGHRTRRQVYLFHGQQHQPVEIFDRDLLSDAYRRMEEELGDHGFVLRCEELSAFARLFVSWSGRHDWPAGIVFFRMETLLFQDAYRMMKLLPVPESAYPFRVLVDWAHGYLEETRPRWLHVVSRGNVLTAYARTLAQFLCRRTGPVGVIFSQNERLWNEYEYLFPLLRLWVELRHACPRLDRRFFVLGDRTGCGLLAEQWRDPDVRQRVQTQLSKYGRVEPEQLNRDVVFVRGAVEAHEALASARAWVCAADRIAAELMDILQREKKRVPADVEIIGLENDPALFPLGITYCGPDWARLGYLMAHALIGDIPIERTGKGFIRSSARLRERLTTRSL